jgi:hypothetical protein
MLNTAGVALTVMVAFAAQPVGNVYVIADVPGAMQEARPPALMVATDVLLLVHVPPAVLLKLTEEPTQPAKAGVAVMGNGRAFMVTLLKEAQPDASV